MRAIHVGVEGVHRRRPPGRLVDPVDLRVGADEVPLRFRRKPEFRDPEPMHRHIACATMRDPQITTKSRHECQKTLAAFAEDVGHGDIDVIAGAHGAGDGEPLARDDLDMLPGIAAHLESDKPNVSAAKVVGDASPVAVQDGIALPVAGQSLGIGRCSRVGLQLLCLQPSVPLGTLMPVVSGEVRGGTPVASQEGDDRHGTDLRQRSG